MTAQRRPVVRCLVALTILPSAGLLVASPPQRVKGTRAFGRVASESDRMLAAKRLISESDNCPLDPNPKQEDIDLDGQDDACDPDGDGDGLSNDNGVCPFTFDPSQADRDGDGLGDACDPCPDDADEVTAWTTGIPEIGVDPKPIVPDSDGDGTPDACDGTRYWPTFPGLSGSPDGGVDVRQHGVRADPATGAIVPRPPGPGCAAEKDESGGRPLARVEEPRRATRMHHKYALLRTTH
ncbi:MAG TPA: thrombospondin type 3 repeat-containing protein [Candidatus Polarisedimenticolia bacterium]|jgi:hypothetical protein|nr:thrombospondin type 3 repeat-containing protein [Candidatus Polarisedimenticolia bacterium]